MFAAVALTAPTAAAKACVITFGKWTTVQGSPGTGVEGEKPPTLKVQALVVDGFRKEFVPGSPHEGTHRRFVVRRMFGVNRSLPKDSGTPGQ